MATYFSSDLHFDHANVIKYDGRPFKNVEEMNEVLIQNHNSVVSDEDDWYFLGDFSFSKKRTEEFMNRLNGNKFFIKGNHDNHEMIKLYKKYGTYLGELAEVTINGQLIVLCHYSLLVWNKSHRGSYNLFGHSHHSLPKRDDALCLDMGINGDGYNYTPQSFEWVQKQMAKKTWKSIDHHGT